MLTTLIVVAVLLFGAFQAGRVYQDRCDRAAWRRVTWRSVGQLGQTWSLN